MNSKPGIILLAWIGPAIIFSLPFKHTAEASGQELEVRSGSTPNIENSLLNLQNLDLYSQALPVEGDVNQDQEIVTEDQGDVATEAPNILDFLSDQFTPLTSFVQQFANLLGF